MKHQRFVTIHSTVSWQTLEERVRSTTLLNRPEIQPYATATISLQRVYYSNLRTTSLYVARNHLYTQERIAHDIQAQGGHHPLELTGGLILTGFDPEGRPTRNTLVPPIVEHTETEGLYLLDGSHRVNRGRWQGREWFNAIVISNIDPRYPAYALPNKWDEVVVYDTPPREPMLRKNYRQSPDYYTLYRDFSILNGSRPRYSS